MSFFVARKIKFDKSFQRKKTGKSRISDYERHKRKEDIYERQLYIGKSALVVKIEGELDQHSAVELRRSLDERISLGCDNLVFDLGRLEFMDSSGIGVIIGRYKNVTALGGRAAIAAAKPQVERIIRLSAIDKIIPLYKDVDEAINAIESTKEEVR